MVSQYLPPLLSSAAAVPGGWLAALLARREVASASVQVVPVIGASLLMGLWAAVVVPPGLLLVLTLLLAWALLVLGIVDLLAFRLPDILTFPLTGAGLVAAFWLPDHDPAAHWAGSAIGFAALYGISIGYSRIRGREGLGLGDAKLAAAAGAWLGWRPLPSLLLIACAAGFVSVGIGVMVRGRAALGEEIAFGVPLCLAFWIVWLYGPPGL